MKMISYLGLFFIVFSAFSAVTTYRPTDENSSVKFKIKNLGITVDGTFKGLKGVVEFEPSKPEAAQFEVSVDASTINTGINARDKHLKKEEYFDIEKYATIKFASTKITASANANTFTINGKLTIKNITKVISFPFTATPQNSGYMFKGEFKINRRDFNVGGNSITLSDNLVVYLEVFVNKN